MSLFPSFQRQVLAVINLTAATLQQTPTYVVTVASPAVVLKLIHEASSALTIPSQKAGPIPLISNSRTSACIRGSFIICSASGSGDEYPTMVGPKT